MEQLLGGIVVFTRMTRSSDEDNPSADDRSVLDGLDLTRRGVVRALAGASLPVVGAGGLPTADARSATAESGTLSNDSIAVQVGDSGIFQLTTAGGQQLTYPSASTSGLTVRVDETNYVIGTPPGESLNGYRRETTVDEDNGVAETAWELPEGVVVTQTISLAGPAARFDLAVSNESDAEHTVQIRYLFDYQVGPQDGAPIFVNGEVITNETRFEPPSFGSWQTYDQLPDPSLTGRGTLVDTPTKIEFVAWEDANGTGYAYEGFDPEKEFFTPGSTSSPASDSAGLLYYELGAVPAGESDSIATYYGVGEPLQSDVDQLDEALVEYREAVVDYLDRIVTAQARALASQYVRPEIDEAYDLDRREERSWAFRSALVTSFGVRAGETNERRTYEPYFDGLRSLLDTVSRHLTEEAAADLASFAGEAFDAVPDDADEEDAVETLAAYLLGEGDDQENPLTVGGSTLADLRDAFVAGFDERREAFVSECRNADVGPDAVDAMVRQVGHRTEALTALADRKTSTYRSLVERVGEGETVASTADVGTLEGPVSEAIGDPVGVGAGTLTGRSEGGESTTLGIGTSVGDIGTAVGGVVAPTVAEGDAGGRRWSQSFAEDAAWKAVAAFELQWLTALRSAPVRVLPSALLSYAEEDLAGRNATVPGTMFEAGCPATVERVGMTVDVGQVSTTNVTEDRQLGDSSLAAADGSVEITNPEENGQPVVPAFLRDECMVVPHTTADEAGRGYLTLPPRSELPAIQPGETATIPFSYVLPLRSNADFELQFRVKATPVSRPVQSGIGFVVHQVGAAAEVDSETVASGTANEGESSDGSFDAGDATQSEVSLTYGGSDLDLHLYDSAGNHVGQNYQNGEYEEGIPGAVATGPDRGTGYEAITVEDIEGTYETTAVAVSTPPRGSTFSVTSARSGRLPPSPELDSSDVSLSGPPGEDVETTLRLRETAGDSPIESVEAELSDLSDDNGNDPGFAAETDFDDEVAAGGSAEVTVALEIPGGASGGRYAGTLDVTAGEQSFSVPAEVAVRTQSELFPEWVPYAVGAGVIGGGGLLGYRYLAGGDDAPPAEGATPQGAPPTGEDAAGAQGAWDPDAGPEGGPQQPPQGDSQQQPQGGPQQPPQDGSQQPPQGGPQQPPQDGSQQPPQGDAQGGGSGGAASGSGGEDGVATVDCPNCGQPNLAGSAVCGSCGQQLR